MSHHTILKKSGLKKVLSIASDLKPIILAAILATVISSAGIINSVADIDQLEGKETSTIKEWEGQTLAGAGIDTIEGQTVAGGASPDDCGTTYGTYMMVWTGDHASGASYVCYDSGNEAKTFYDTSGGGVTFSTTDIQFSGSNVYTVYGVSTNDLISDSAATIYLTVSLTDDGDTTWDHVTWFEIYEDMDVRSYSILIGVISEQIFFDWNDGTNSISHYSGGATVSYDGTFRIGITWQTSSNDIGLSVVAVGNPPTRKQGTIITVKCIVVFSCLWVRCLIG